MKITSDQAVQLAEDTVAKYGAQTVYTPLRGACVYVDPHTNRPSCLVGHILVSAGVDPEYLVKVNQRRITALAREGLIEMDTETLWFLAALQEDQDDTVSWGQALEESKKVLRAVSLAHADD